MAPDISGDLGTILGIWAHPDDEAYLSAGLMAAAVAAGRRVVCVTATQGEAGFPASDIRPADERSAIRRAELAASLEILGVTEHHWLGYGDGRCDDVPDEEAVQRLLPLLRDARPDTVLTFGPDGATGHRDHIAACRWATLAVERAGLPDTRLLYATKSVDWDDEHLLGVDLSQVTMVHDLVPESVEFGALAVWFTCDDELSERKLRALRAQASQVEPLVELMGLDVYERFIRDEFFRAPLPDDPAVMARTRALRPR